MVLLLVEAVYCICKNLKLIIGFSFFKLISCAYILTQELGWCKFDMNIVVVVWTTQLNICKKKLFCI